VTGITNVAIKDNPKTQGSHFRPSLTYDGLFIFRLFPSRLTIALFSTGL